MATNNKNGGIGFDFVDPLFSIALAFGVSEGAFKSKSFNLLKEGNFSEIFFNAHLLSSLSFLIAGFVFIVTSWVHYHRSIQYNPIEKNTRFYADIAMVWLYMFLLVFYNMPFIFLVILTFIYILYTLWDVIAISERPVKYGIKPDEASFVSCMFKLLFCYTLKLYFDPNSRTVRAFCYTTNDGLKAYENQDKDYMQRRSAISFSWMILYFIFSLLLINQKIAAEYLPLVGIGLISAAFLYRQDKIKQFTIWVRIGGLLALLLILFWD